MDEDEEEEEEDEDEEDDDDDEDDEEEEAERGRDRDGSVGEGGAVRRIPVSGDEGYRKRGVRAFARTCVRVYVRACVRAGVRACARTVAWANALSVSVSAARMVKGHARGWARVRRDTRDRRWCPEDRDSSRELQRSVRERSRGRAIARAHR